MFISDCGNILAHITSNESIYTTTLQLNIYHGLIQQSWSQIRIPPCKIHVYSDCPKKVSHLVVLQNMTAKITRKHNTPTSLTTLQPNYVYSLQPNVMVQMPFDRRNNSYLGKWLNHKQNWTTKVFCWIVDCISVQGMQQVRAFQLQLRFCFLFKDYHHKSIIYNIQCKNASHSHPPPPPQRRILEPTTQNKRIYHKNKW